MQENKFRYSKCPHCGRHGIPAFYKLTVKLRRPALTCIYCKKTFQASFLYGILMLTAWTGSVIGYVPLIRILNIAPSAIGLGAVMYSVASWCLIQYFIPIREVIPPRKPPKKKHHHPPKRR